MQSLGWYTNRLRSMSIAEIAWRCRNKLRGVADSALLASRARGCRLSSLRKSKSGEFEYGRTAINDAWIQKGAATGSKYPDEWRQRLIERANCLLAHHFELFDRPDVFLGDDILWNYEPKAEKVTPTGPSSKIDYRDYKETGDCKWVWEQNRHHHFVVLARAYQVSGDTRYAQEIVDQIRSWICACPYGHGMNWRSPLEFGVRMINWAHAWELIRSSGVVTKEVEEELLPIVHRHLWEIQRNYSQYSSANNHLIGEAAGVFIGASYFRGFKQSRRWRERARVILEREIQRQTFDEGGNVEQATGYHLFVMEFLAFAGMAARRNGCDFSEAYWSRLNLKFEFLSALTEGGPLPMTGDADDGYVLDLGGNSNRAESLLALRGALFGQVDLMQSSNRVAEPYWWFFGPSHEEPGYQKAARRRQVLTSRAIESSGHYLLQNGTAGSKDAISVVIDCGCLGFGSIAAHGHADALSLILRVGGHDVLVDPGTYDYFTYPEWRDYFRSTRAHNTVEVDGQDQSVMLGSFLWGARAEAKCTKFVAADDGGLFVGEHDGYSRLEDPVIHRRSISLRGKGPGLIVCDELVAKKDHAVKCCWHLAETSKLDRRGDHLFEIDYGGGVVMLEFPKMLTVQVVQAQLNSPVGWVSRGYHRKAASTSIIASGVINGSQAWETRIYCGSTKVEAPIGRDKKPERKVVRATVAP